jgi:hypothetical protein
VEATFARDPARVAPLRVGVPAKAAGPTDQIHCDEVLAERRAAVTARPAARSHRRRRRARGCVRRAPSRLARQRAPPAYDGCSGRARWSPRSATRSLRPGRQGTREAPRPGPGRPRRHREPTLPCRRAARRLQWADLLRPSSSTTCSRVHAAVTAPSCSPSVGASHHRERARRLGPLPARRPSQIAVTSSPQLRFGTMAIVLKFHAVVSGNTLQLPDLGAFEGKRVEVIVVEDEALPALTPQPTQRRPLGLLRGQLVVPDDFDAPLPPDTQKYFDGDGDGDRDRG